MPLRPCLQPGCPNLSTQSRCPTHRRNPKASWSTNRNPAAHKRFARAVKARDGNRCVRCGSTTDLRAAHTVPISKGGGYHPSQGVTLCKPCDKATDRHAR